MQYSTFHCIHLTLCACAIRLSAIAQVQAPERTLALPVEWTTVDDGLPQGMVRAIIQDRTGYMWFGTKDGLVRSDGVSYRVFKHDEGDSTSLCGNHITYLLQGHDGSLWVATENDGIDRYDPYTERFAHVRPGVASDEPVGRSTRCMQEDIHGNIWVLSQHSRLFVIERTPGESHSELMGEDIFRPPNAVLSGFAFPDSVGSILTTSSGDLWLTGKDELYVLHIGNGAHEPRIHPLPEPQFEVIPWEEPCVLINDTLTGQVLLTRGATIIRYDVKAGSPVDTLRLASKGPLGGNLLLDRRSRLWVCFDHGYGIARVSLADGGIEYLSFAPQNHIGFPPSPLVINWAEDREGNIWAGTGGFGLVKYRAITERFHRTRIGIYSTFIQADLSGDHIIVGETAEQVGPTDGSGRILSIRTRLNAAGMRPAWGVVVVDPRGVQWACAEPSIGGPSALVSHDPTTGRVNYEQLGPDDHTIELLPGLGDEVWIEVFSEKLNRMEHLVRFDTRTHRVVARYPVPQPIEVLEYRAISNWYVDASGSAWLGTLKGVFVLHTSDGTWDRYEHDPSKPRSLPDAPVFSLCADPDDPEHFLWVGTDGSGLARLDLRTGECKLHTMRQGLPNDVIYGILPDTRHNLWLSTNNGLCRFDPRTTTSSHFTKEDGLCGNEFNRYSALKGADGRLYFAGVDGVTSFDPEDLYERLPPTPTRITRLRLANQDVVAGMFRLPDEEAPLLSKAIGFLKELQLPHDQRMVSFSFASMDHTAPDKNRYRYKLDGFNKDWIEVGAAHEAAFTNLDPGTYTFHVQGRNSAGVLDEKGASIALIITPPWWGTWWFRIAAIAMFSCALYGFYRYRLAQELRVARVRERIARDLHDEMGSTLSSVALFSEVATLESGVDDATRRSMLTRISQSTSQMLESMNDIVWAVNSRNDDLQHVMLRMKEFGSRIAEACGFEVEFAFETGEGKGPLSMVQRKNLYLIYKEAVNNAAKYAQCQRLHVSITRAGASMVLLVRDDGKGMDRTNGTPFTARGGGNGLGNMQARAVEIGGSVSITSEPGQGTVVELRFKP